MSYRTGSHCGIHVYEGDRPVATFFNPLEARAFVDAMNAVRPIDAIGVMVAGIRRTHRNRANKAHVIEVLHRSDTHVTYRSSIAPSLPVATFDETYEAVAAPMSDGRV